MSECRIKLEDGMMTVMTKMSEGNSGALTCLMELQTTGKDIDPQAAMGGMHSILMLDTLGIYGTDIYVLWSDICNRNTSIMIAVLRAYQLSIIEGKIVADAASRQDYSGRELLDLDDICDKVVERLPEFKLALI